jgi:hypothetical protein
MFSLCVAHDAEPAKTNEKILKTLFKKIENEKQVMEVIDEMKEKLRLGDYLKDLEAIESDKFVE